MHVKLFAHTTAKVLKKKLSGKLINTSMSLEILGEQKIRSMKEKNGTVLFRSSMFNMQFQLVIWLHISYQIYRQ